MGQIKVEKNAGGIKGLCVIEPTVHGDARGYFMETYNQKDMEEMGLVGEEGYTGDYEEEYNEEYSEESYDEAAEDQNEESEEIEFIETENE